MLIKINVAKVKIFKKKFSFLRKTKEKFGQMKQNLTFLIQKKNKQK